jgi:hypothetical protein
VDGSKLCRILMVGIVDSERQNNVRDILCFVVPRISSRL